jgi:hypothetical protein
LEFNLEEFKEFNIQNNPLIADEDSFKPILPSPDNIYFKDFHFLDEPLIKRKVICDNNHTTPNVVDDQITLSNQKDEHN